VPKNVIKPVNAYSTKKMRLAKNHSAICVPYQGLNFN